MNIFEIIFIAIGLAMDTFVISITTGFVTKKNHINNALKMALSFGFFQMGMPIIGWFAGVGLKNYISNIDHWIVFGILCFIGSKMIYESFQMKKNDEKSETLNLYNLLFLSIATSIDALAIGLSFALLKVSLVLPILIIGIITFILSLTGFFLGNKIGHFFENKIEIFGGLVLIGIGIKILLEHL